MTETWTLNQLLSALGEDPQHDKCGVTMYKNKLFGGGWQYGLKVGFEINDVNLKIHIEEVDPKQVVAKLLEAVDATITELQKILDQPKQLAQEILRMEEINGN